MIRLGGLISQNPFKKEEPKTRVISESRDPEVDSLFKSMDTFLVNTFHKYKDGWKDRNTVKWITGTPAFVKKIDTSSYTTPDAAKLESDIIATVKQLEKQKADYQKLLDKYKKQLK